MSDLARLLARLLPDPDRIRFAVLTAGAGVDPDGIDFRGGATLIWERVADEAWKRGRVERIVEAVAREYPKSAATLAAARDAYLAARVPAAGTDPDGRGGESSHSTEELIAILEQRAATITFTMEQEKQAAVANIANGGGWGFGSAADAATRFDAIRVRFLELHAQHVHALRSGRVVLAHEIVVAIHRLLWIQSRDLFRANDRNLDVNYCWGEVDRPRSYISAYPGHALAFLVPPESADQFGSFGDAGLEEEAHLASVSKLLAERPDALPPMGRGFQDVLNSPAALIAALGRDENKGVRWAAARALATAGPDATVAVDALLSALEDKSHRVREAAKRSLRQHGPVALPGVLKRCTDLRTGASLQDLIDVLVDVGRDDRRLLPLILSALCAESPGIRAAAASALGRIGVEPKLAAPALSRALGDHDEVVRAEAAAALGSFGSAAGDAVPLLSRLLADGAREAVRPRSLAAAALGRIGGPKAVDALASAVDQAGSADDVRLAAICALGSLGAVATEAVSVLVRVLSHDGPELRAEAAAALGKMAPRSRPALPALLGALAVEDDRVLAAAAAALGAFGPEARDAVPALTQLLGRNQGTASQHAARALGAVGVEALAPLTDAARSEHTGVRALAAVGLGYVGPEAVPVLIGMWTADGDFSVRDRVSDALVQIGNPSVPALRAALQHESWRVRRNARKTLERIR